MEKGHSSLDMNVLSKCLLQCVLFINTLLGIIIYLKYKFPILTSIFNGK